MKRLLLMLLLLFGCIGFADAAEHILLGRVVDAASESGVGYATILLTDAEGKGVAAVAADKEGSFRLFYNKNGNFKLVISSVGYASAEKNIVLGAENETIELGSVALQAGVEIESIDIKPLVIEKEDRLVYNVKADPEAKYRKMSAIMAKVPGLTPSGSRGNLRYNNRPIGQILINGKPETLISAIRQYTMSFIGAAVMDEIEVIPPGSPEYNNDKIIINIKTNQALPIGFASELGGDAAPKEGHYKADVDLVAKVSSKLTFGANYAYSLTHSPTLHQNSRSEYLGANGGAVQYIQHNNAADSTRGQTHKFGIDYSGKFSTNGSFSVRLGGDVADQNRYGYSESWRVDGASGEVTNNQRSDSHSNSSSPRNISGKVSITHPIVAGRSTMFFSSTYNHNESTTDSWVNTGIDDVATFATHRSSFTQQDMFNALLRTSFSLSKNSKELYPLLTAWVNYTRRNYDNSSLYETSAGGSELVADPNDGLYYNQNIVTATLNGSFKPKSKLFGSFTLGFRMFYDHTTGLYRNTENTPLDYSMWNWGGTANFSLMKGPLPLHASLNITPKQPSFSLLNPYVDNSNPMHLRYGNPNLRPEMSYSLNVLTRLPRGIKWLPRWLRIGMPTYRFTYIDNSINPITEMRPDGVMVSTYANYGSEQRHYISGGVDFVLTKRTSLSASGSFSSSIYNISEEYKNTINSFTWGLSADHQFRNTKWFENTSLSASYSARPTATMAQAVKWDYYHHLDLSFSTYMPKIKAGFAVKVGDILHGHNFVESTIRSGTFISHSSNEVLGRSINISAYIRFGQFRKAKGEVDTPDDTLKTF